jgi:hypothetical protein
MLTNAEQAALNVFRSFMVGAGEMLCFQGPQLQKHGATLRQLTEKNYLIKEQFAGGYSLTRAGVEAMAAARQAKAVAAHAAAARAAASQAARAKAAPAKPALVAKKTEPTSAASRTVKPRTAKASAVAQSRRKPAKPARSR